MVIVCVALSLLPVRIEVTVIVNELSPRDAEVVVDERFESLTVFAVVGEML